MCSANKGLMNLIPFNNNLSLRYCNLNKVWQSNGRCKSKGYHVCAIDTHTQTYIFNFFSPALVDGVSPHCGSFLDLFFFCTVHGSVLYVVCTLLSASNASEQSLQVRTDQKSTMNESSSAGAEESTWSSGQQMKMENCYHLWVLFKYMQAREAVRSWWMPRVPAVVDMIKKYLGKPLPPPQPPSLTIHHHNRQTDVCRSTCKCRKLSVCKIAFWMRDFVYLLYESNHAFESK